ncbi:unnamed protein product [Blepharisma stoltei]|uniref:TOG domain-containing protein n=1 Tax=Blepharisma stoltei TaxID=1481888 RepID=A0AAU9JN59_9CILI|nr:unnamed protein product [Blepharisma stoltei]
MDARRSSLSPEVPRSFSVLYPDHRETKKRHTITDKSLTEALSLNTPVKRREEDMVSFESPFYKRTKSPSFNDEEFKHALRSPLGSSEKIENNSDPELDVLYKQRPQTSRDLRYIDIDLENDIEIPVIPTEKNPEFFIQHNKKEDMVRLDESTDEIKQDSMRTRKKYQEIRINHEDFVERQNPFRVEELEEKKKDDDLGEHLELAERLNHSRWQVRRKVYADIADCFRAKSFLMEIETNSNVFDYFENKLKNIVSDSNLVSQLEGLQTLLCYVNCAPQIKNTVFYLGDELIPKCALTKPKSGEMVNQIIVRMLERDTELQLFHLIIKRFVAKNQKEACFSIQCVGNALPSLPLVAHLGKSLYNALNKALAHNISEVRIYAMNLLVDLFCYTQDPIDIFIPHLNLKPQQIKEIKDHLLNKDKIAIKWVIFEDSKKNEDENLLICESLEDNVKEDLISLTPQGFFETPYTADIKSKREIMGKFIQAIEKPGIMFEMKDYGTVINTLLHLVENTNVLVYMEAMKAIEILIPKISKSFTYKGKQYVQFLADKFKEKKKPVISSINQILHLFRVHEVLSANTIIDLLVEIAITHKVPTVRELSLLWICDEFKTSNKNVDLLSGEDFAPWYSAIIENISENIGKKVFNICQKDVASNVRDAGIKLLGVLRSALISSPLFNNLDILISKLPKRRIIEIDKNTQQIDIEESFSKELSVHNQNIISKENESPSKPEESVDEVENSISEEIRKLIDCSDNSSKEKLIALGIKIDTLSIDSPEILHEPLNFPSISLKFIDAINMIKGKNPKLTQESKAVVNLRFITNWISQRLGNNLFLNQPEQLNTLLIAVQDIDEKNTQFSEIFVKELRLAKLQLMTVLNKMINPSRELSPLEKMSIDKISAQSKEQSPLLKPLKSSSISPQKSRSASPIDKLNYQKLELDLAEISITNNQFSDDPQHSVTFKKEMENLSKMIKEGDSHFKLEGLTRLIHVVEDWLAACEELKTKPGNPGSWRRGMGRVSQDGSFMKPLFDSFDELKSLVIDISQCCKYKQYVQDPSNFEEIQRLTLEALTSLRIVITDKEAEALFKVLLFEIPIKHTTSSFVKNFNEKAYQLFSDWLAHMPIGGIINNLGQFFTENGDYNINLIFIHAIQWILTVELPSATFEIDIISPILVALIKGMAGCPLISSHPLSESSSQLMISTSEALFLFLVQKFGEEKVTRFIENQLINHGKLLKIYTKWIDNLHKFEEPKNPAILQTVLSSPQMSKINDVSFECSIKKEEQSGVLTAKELEYESRRLESSKKKLNFDLVPESPGTLWKKKGFQENEQFAEAQKMLEEVNKEYLTQVALNDILMKQLEEQKELNKKLASKVMEPVRPEIRASKAINPIKVEQELRQPLQQVTIPVPYDLKNTKNDQTNTQKERSSSPPKIPETAQKPFKPAVEIFKPPETFSLLPLHNKIEGIFNFQHLLLYCNDPNAELLSPLLDTYTQLKTSADKQSLLKSLHTALNQEDILAAMNLFVYKAVLEAVLRFCSLEKFLSEKSAPQSLLIESLANSQDLELTNELQKIAAVLLEGREPTQVILILFQVLQETIPREFREVLPHDRGIYIRLLLKCMTKLLTAVQANNQNIRVFDILVELNRLFEAHPPEELTTECPSVYEYEHMFKVLRNISDIILSIQPEKVQAFLKLITRQKERPKNIFVKYMSAALAKRHQMSV